MARDGTAAYVHVTMVGVEAYLLARTAESHLILSTQDNVSTQDKRASPPPPFGTHSVHASTVSTLPLSATTESPMPSPLSHSPTTITHLLWSVLLRDAEVLSRDRCMNGSRLRWGDGHFAHERHNPSAGGEERAVLWQRRSITPRSVRAVV